LIGLSGIPRAVLRGGEVAETIGGGRCRRVRECPLMGTRVVGSYVRLG
jgi:hypothetical protein